jgi:type I restriction-modification system DNA methylase subunit
MNLFETYLADLEAIYRTGASTKETSFYPAINTLFDSLGKTLKPRVRCVLTLKNQGAGMPDGGFFTASQLQRGDNQPQSGQPPERGAIEIKGFADDVQKIADSEQVRKYLAKYGLVLVTNYRDFLLVALENGEPKELERYTLAENQAKFWARAADKRAFAAEHEARFLEYLKRVMQHNAPLSNPQEVAWFLASYARDAKARIETVDFPALKKLREALEEALGIRFEGERGENFFHSTLIQTLFYGVFSAWVLWHKENPLRADDFRWREAGFYLGVPVIQVLFDEIAKPGNLRNLDLVEVLDWTGNVLNRIVRQEFFARFDEGQAVQYFYEPFLQQFDPELRKQLGVWYTPQEIVKYMVARVDTVLKEELNLADGLADPNVYVLDPCCGTGAYLVEVLNHIHQTLEQRGEGALAAEDLKRAATERVFGFEILPAPFVVAHLQLGLLLNNLGANIEEGERVGVYLTNALTGWDSIEAVKKQLTLPEMQEERDQAEEIKQIKPILVILGNPPYNGKPKAGEVDILYSSTEAASPSVDVAVYKEKLNLPIEKGGWGIKKFNLDELYARFFRLAERRIAEKT